MTQGLDAELRHGIHFAKVTQEEAWGALNYFTDLACSLSLPEEKKNQTPADQPMLSVTRSNSTTQDNEGLKSRQIWSTKIILSFITERHMISRAKPIAYNWFSMKNHCLLIPWSTLQYLLCSWRHSSQSPVSELKVTVLLYKLKHPDSTWQLPGCCWLHFSLQLAQTTLFPSPLPPHFPNE